MYRNRAHRLGVLLSSLAIMLAPHPTRAAIAGSGPGAPLASSFPGPLWELVIYKPTHRRVIHGNFVVVQLWSSALLIHDWCTPSSRRALALQ